MNEKLQNIFDALAALNATGFAGLKVDDHALVFFKDMKPEEIIPLLLEMANRESVIRIGIVAAAKCIEAVEGDNINVEVDVKKLPGIGQISKN